MDGEALRERVAEIHRHGGEGGALDMAVAVKEGVNLPKPAERVGQGDQPSEVVRVVVGKQISGVLQQFGHARRHFVWQAEFIVVTWLSAKILRSKSTVPSVPR